MKRKIFSLFMAFMLMTLLIPVGIVQAKGVTTTKKNGSIVVSTSEYSFTLPKAWKKYPYVIKKEGNFVGFYSKSNMKKYEGWVFSVGRLTTAEWKEEGRYYLESGGVKLATKGKYVYFTAYPQDVQFNYNNEKLRTEYMELQKNLTIIKKTFKLK